MVLLMIANHAHADGTGAYPGFETLAREARITPRQVINVIAKLEKSGELSVKRGAGLYGTNLYTIRMHCGEKITREKISPPEKISREKRSTPISPEPSLTKTLKTTPLPPASGGLEIFSWAGQTIEVEMGRRKRLPTFENYAGARAEQVVAFLARKGFTARVMEAQ